MNAWFATLAGVVADRRTQGHDRGYGSLDPVTGWLARVRAHILTLAPMRRDSSSPPLRSYPATSIRCLAPARQLARPTLLAPTSFNDGTAGPRAACRTLACTVNSWVMPEGGVPIA